MHIVPSRYLQVPVSKKKVLVIIKGICGKRNLFLKSDSRPFFRGQFLASYGTRVFIIVLKIAPHGYYNKPAESTPNTTYLKYILILSLQSMPTLAK